MLTSNESLYIFHHPSAEPLIFFEDSFTSENDFFLLSPEASKVLKSEISTKTVVVHHVGIDPMENCKFLDQYELSVVETKSNQIILIESEVESNVPQKYAVLHLNNEKNTVVFLGPDDFEETENGNLLVSANKAKAIEIKMAASEYCEPSILIYFSDSFYESESCYIQILRFEHPQTMKIIIDENLGGVKI